MQVPGALDGADAGRFRLGLLLPPPAPPTEPSERQREPGVDHHCATCGGNTGDGLSPHAQTFTSVGEARQQAQPLPGAVAGEVGPVHHRTGTAVDRERASQLRLRTVSPVDAEAERGVGPSLPR